MRGNRTQRRWNVRCRDCDCVGRAFSSEQQMARPPYQPASRLNSRARRAGPHRPPRTEQRVRQHQGDQGTPAPSPPRQPQDHRKAHAGNGDPLRHPPACRSPCQRATQNPTHTRRKKRRSRQPYQPALACTLIRNSLWGPALRDQTRIVAVWCISAEWAVPDLNREPQHFQCCALPIELTARSGLFPFGMGRVSL